jgi:hypothetical protein
MASRSTGEGRKNAASVFLGKQVINAEKFQAQVNVLGIKT